MDKLNLINPQWQGGADIAVLAGTREIEELYLKDAPAARVPVSGNPALTAEHGVLGYREIKQQTLDASGILRGSGAKRVFTVGGSCDADAASILYANEIYRGDLAVLWLDAHGDINAPEESATHLFYGMPVRMLLGGCGAAFADIVPEPMAPRQFVHLGARDLEAAESRFMRRRRMPVIPARGGPGLPGAIPVSIARQSCWPSRNRCRRAAIPPLTTAIAPFNRAMQVPLAANAASSFSAGGPLSSSVQCHPPSRVV